MSVKGLTALGLALLSCVFAIIFVMREIPTVRGRQQSVRKYRIEVILKARANPPDFWRIVEQGVDMASAEFSVDCNVSGPERESDIDRQILLVEEAVERRPDAIILAAGDVDRLVPVCDRISEAGIALILVDSDANTDKKLCFVGTDNYMLGQKLAELLDRQLGPGERFGVIGHVPGTSTAIERSKGLLENVSNVQCLAGIDYCDGSTEIAHLKTVRMLTENPDIRCMVGLNESSTLGISTALTEMGLAGKIKLVACDSSQAQIQYMEDGTIQAVVIQNPFNMGYLSVQAAVNAIEGKKVDRVINTGCIVITRDDMHKQENQKLLFPFIESTPNPAVPTSTRQYAQ